MDTLGNGTCLSLQGHGYNGPAYENQAIACTAFTEWDATGWTSKMWWKGAAGSIQLTTRSIIRNCVMKNVVQGPFCHGDSMLIEGNLVENYSQDGLRMSGTGTVMRNNIIKNNINCSANHDDAIQCYPSSNYGVLDGNIIIEFDFTNNDWGAADTASRPFSGPLQVIFGGPWNNGRIVNNVVVVDHWHGISMGGDNTQNNLVINNTVIDLVTGNERVPWIRNTSTGTGHIARNNVGPSGASGQTSDHNFSIGSTPLADLFEDPDNFDFRPKKGGALVDAGSADNAPATDLNGVSRPQGAGVDIGAYEWVEVSIADQSPHGLKPGYRLPEAHPIKMKALQRLVSTGTAKLYDLKGKPVLCGNTTSGGIYLVEIAGTAPRVMVVVE
jgi:hypothetical protein